MTLKYNHNEKTTYENIEISFDKELLKNLDVNKIEVIENNFTINTRDELTLEFSLKGNFYIPCSVTRKEVKIPFEIENIINIDEYEREFNENIKINENTLEIFPIIWENVLVEIPMKVTTDETEINDLKGDGWEFVTSEHSNEKKNNPFEKLKDLI